MADTTTPLRLAIRRLWRDRAFSLAVVASLALGVGVNVTMLSTVDALLFRPPAQVHDVGSVVRIESPTFESSTYPDYVNLRNEARTLAGLAVYAPRRLSAIIDGALLVLRALLTSHTYFSLLGVRAERGRFYAADEDRRGAAHTAVVSHELWRHQWDGRDNVIGAPLRIGGEIFTVVGVAPPRFTGTETAPVDLFLPVESSLSASDAVGLTDRRWTWVRIIGRLASDASSRQAAAEATAIFRRSNLALPDADRRGCAGDAAGNRADGSTLGEA